MVIPRAKNGSAVTLASSDPEPVRIGLLVGEPIRDAGLASIFDLPAEQGHAPLVPVRGSLRELLALNTLQYLVVDLHSSTGGFEALKAVRQRRPDIRSIVIGPEGDEDLVLTAITAGARAYLGLSAGPEMVRQAIEVVTSGSIWAPRHLLSRLIDRLLGVSRVTRKVTHPQLTLREHQVLELLLSAHSTREIASGLGIGERTVKAYIGRLMRKTGSDSRVKLSISALSRSIMPSAASRRARSAKPDDRINQ